MQLCCGISLLFWRNFCHVPPRYSYCFRSDIRVFLCVFLISAWNFILQAIHLKYLHPDSELHNFALQVMEMLRVDTSVDAQALVCFLAYLQLQLYGGMFNDVKVCIVQFLWVFNDVEVCIVQFLWVREWGKETAVSAWTCIGWEFCYIDVCPRGRATLVRLGCAFTLYTLGIWLASLWCWCVSER